MKRLFLLSLLWISVLQSFAQQTTVVHGKLLNLAENKLEIVASTGYLKDSIPVSKDGTFSYIFKGLAAPIRLSLTNRKQVQIQLFIAPGYNLEISADVKTLATIKSTLVYKGLGSKSNSYWIQSVARYKFDTVKWHLKKPDEYITHLLQVKNDTKLIDSVFGSNNKEPYAGYFKKSLLLDKKYSPLLGIYSSYGYEQKLTWSQIDELLVKLEKISVNDELNNPDNLISSSFSYFVRQYAFYCDFYDAFPADSTRKKEPNYTLYLTDKLLRGRVYDYVASEEIASTLLSTYKSSDVERLQPFINKINDRQLKIKLVAEKERQLISITKFAKGAPSPGFNLADTSGTIYNLAQFKGKVVYIDLWASWCGPCKEETPYLKKIYEKYKSNPDLAIISIAAFDVKNRKRRYEIIKKDQMDWLQLEDTSDNFAKSYQANFIPRFIIIDKKGNIVDSDAVRPSEPEKLIAILDHEISK